MKALSRGLRLGSRVRWHSEEARAAVLRHFRGEENRPDVGANGVAVGMEKRLREMAPREVTGLPCVTRESIERVLAEVREGRRVPLMDAMQTIMAATLILQQEPSVKKMSGDVVVVGDLHGSLGDFLHIIDTYGLPGDRYQFVFNGDIVDRGNNACEIILLLFMLKLYTPNAVHINQGNHEDKTCTMYYGFFHECIAKYNMQLYECMMTAFSWLPYAAVVNDYVFVCHGGLFDGTIDDIAAVPRGTGAQLTMKQRDMVTDLLWSDPSEGMRRSDPFGRLPFGKQGAKDWKPSGRGVGKEFGEGYTRAWLEANSGIEYIVRSHQCMAKGVEIAHSGLVWTVFSSSNYHRENNAAVLLFPAALAKSKGRPVADVWKPVNLDLDDPSEGAVWHPGQTNFQMLIGNQPPPPGSANAFALYVLNECRDVVADAIREHDPKQTGYISTEMLGEILRDTMGNICFGLQAPEQDPVSYQDFFDMNFAGSTPPVTWSPWFPELYGNLQSSPCATIDDFKKKYRCKKAKRRVREMFPKEFLSSVQLEKFIRYSNANSKDTPHGGEDPVVPVEWSLCRRSERIANIRKTLEANQAHDKVVAALQASAAGDNVLAPSALVTALQGVNAHATPCLVSDIKEQLQLNASVDDLPLRPVIDLLSLRV